MEKPDNLNMPDEETKIVSADPIAEETETMTSDEKTEVLSSEPVKETKPKKVKKERHVSIPVCVICCLLVAAFVFLGTYQGVMTAAKRDIMAIQQQKPVYDKLHDIENIFHDHYLYDLDTDTVNTALAKAYLIGSGDRFATYYTKEQWDEYVNNSMGDAVGIGIYVVMSERGNILITKVMENSPAMQAGMMDGDEIVAIDGVSVESIGYVYAPDYIIGEVGSTVKLDVIRNGEKLTVPVIRNHYEPQNIFAELITVDGVKYGYIKIMKFQKITAPQFISAVEALLKENIQGVIYDVRDNPGGDSEAITTILDFLLPEGVIYTSYDSNNQLLEKKMSDANELNLPMVVLVNDMTASAAELFTCALHDYDKAEIVGKTTYGKGCGQTAFPIAGGDVVFVTNFLYNPPKSENYDKVGIKPDYDVDLDEKWNNSNLFLIPHEEDAQLLKGLDVLIQAANS